MLVPLAKRRIVRFKMSQPQAESHTDSIQAALYGMQRGLLPLLNSFDMHGGHVSLEGAQLFQFRSELGCLTVSHAMELLHVRITDAAEVTPSRVYRSLESPESIGLRTEYQIGPDGLITPTALYSRLSFAARILDEGQPQIGRYTPKYKIDHTTTLESDVHGPLSHEGMERLQGFVAPIVLAATEIAQKNHLQLVPPIGE
jgi:hypothetical protein